MFARGGGSGDCENAGSDDRSHSQRDQAPHAQRLFEPPVRLFGSRNESVDAFGAEELVHRRNALVHYRFLWPFVICCTFFFMEPRATPDARLAFGAAFLRAVR